MTLEDDFTREMWRLYEEPKSFRPPYDAGYFRKLLSEQKAVAVARDLVLDPRPSEGLARLSLARRLDLSVEATVLRARWNSLFTPDVLEAARKKLRTLEYTEPGLDL